MKYYYHPEYDCLFIVEETETVPVDRESLELTPEIYYEMMNRRREKNNIDIGGISDKVCSLN